MKLPYGSLLKIGANSLLAQDSLHLQLIQLEWALGKLRFKRILFLMLFGVPMFMRSLSLLSAGMLVMILTWQTAFKFIAACLLLIFYSAGAYIVYYLLQKETASDNSAFAESRREIAADLAFLRNKLGA